MGEIDRWLEGHGLGKYVEVFVENEIGVDDLADLSEDDLEKLGLPMGPRKRFFRALAGADPPSRQRPAAAPQGPAPAARTPGTGDAERRQLTVMFADLVGSTELSRALDPEDLREINLAYQQAAKAAIEDYGGFVARYMGDGVLAYFGYPQAHEDDAERAVHAGLDMIGAVRSLAVPARLQVRVGVATGPVVVGDIIGEGVSQESAVVGETPNLAARLQGIAGPDVLVIADQTRRLTRGAFVYADLGERVLKGFDVPVQAWEVRGESTSTSRFEALRGQESVAFVGREHDLGMLLERWERAVGGEGQAVLVSGEAGIGKSRVASALRRQLADSSHVWLRHQCTPHHTNSALYPFISQLERSSAMAAGDADDVRLAKLEKLLSLGGEAAGGGALGTLATLLSISTEDGLAAPQLSPQELKARTFRALLEQMVGLVRSRPMLWVFEDAQWADPTTCELVEHAVDRIRDLPVLAVITARPEYAPGWAGLDHASELRLGRLARTQSKALVERLVHGKALPEVVLEQIVDKTDGVPLFVEELTRAVLESDLLVEHADRYELLGPFRAVFIPDTLQDSLMARLDRLGEAKRVAQTAAAVGREFQRRLLYRVMSEDADALDRSLDSLVEAGLLFHRGVAPEDRFVFKHALVQEAALDSMLRRTRQSVHERIAKILEADFPEVRDGEPEVLAHHFEAAGALERSVDYWQRAGQRAAQRFANAEAVSHLGRALQLLATLPESPERDEKELALQVALGPAQMAVKGFASEAVERAYSSARQLCERTGRTEPLFPTLYGLFRLNLIRANYEPAKALAEELLAEAERADDRRLRITAHRAIGNSSLWLGEVSDACAHLALGTSLYDEQADRGLALVFGDDPGVDCLAYEALGKWWLGFPDQALDLRDAAVTLARKLAHPFSLGRALTLGCFVHCCRRDFPALAREARELLDLSIQHKLGNWKGISEMLLGIEVAARGDAEQAHALFARGLEQFLATGGGILTRFLPAFVADAHARRGDAAAGRAALDMALDANDKTVFWDAEIHRIEGTLADSSGAGDEAVEACYRQALSLAREQGARSLELRAAASLARLWSRQGRRTQAAELLQPVHDRFTEGLATPDLRETAALLEELAHA